MCQVFYLPIYKSSVYIGRERRMSGAYSKPMPWAGGGATKPPMANNYLDSHGLNPGKQSLPK